MFTCSCFLHECFGCWNYCVSLKQNVISNDYQLITFFQHCGYGEACPNYLDFTWRVDLSLPKLLTVKITVKGLYWSTGYRRHFSRHVEENWSNLILNQSSLTILKSHDISPFSSIVDILDCIEYWTRCNGQYANESIILNKHQFFFKLLNLRHFIYLHLYSTISFLISIF